MALFHLSVTQTKRSAGQSAIASAAYRAGERLYSEYYGEYLSLIHISPHGRALQTLSISRTMALVVLALTVPDFWQ